MDAQGPDIDTLYLSLGENCLTDGILRRHGLLMAKTPYSDARSNLDYALQLEQHRYGQLLDPSALRPGLAGSVPVVRNTNLTCDAIYDEAHREGFEFTHHDVLNDPAHRESFRRKIARLEAARHRPNVCFVYHYRLNPDADLLAVIDKAVDFLRAYHHSGRMIVFTQEIVVHPAQRGLVELLKGAVTAFVLRTLAPWRGEDPEIFWARRDDDLLAQMFSRAHGVSGPP